MPLGLSYGAPGTAFWGPPSSHMNFCEEVNIPEPSDVASPTDRRQDYVLTTYIAEFFNTITSLAYIAYGIHGILRSKRAGSSPFSVDNIPYTGLIGVGLASGIYHATLKYHTQMGDEMSMHFAIGCVLIKVFSFQQPAHIARRNASIIIVGLTSFIIYHCVTDEFTLHAIIFVTLSLTVIWKTRSIIRDQIEDPEQSDKMAQLATFGTSCAGLAYVLWNIDVHLCDYVTSTKRYLGMPLGILLELHGYWHILTAIASYTFMAMIEFLTYPEHDKTHGSGFFWPAKKVLEEMASQTQFNQGVQNEKAVANGSTKGSKRS